MEYYSAIKRKKVLKKPATKGHAMHDPIYRKRLEQTNLWRWLSSLGAGDLPPPPPDSLTAAKTLEEEGLQALRVLGIPTQPPGLGL